MIYKRGNVYWYDFQFKGQRYRESTRVSNKAAVCQIEAARRSDLALGRVRLDAPSFSDFLNEEFLPWSRVQNQAITFKRYKVSSKPLRGFFGKLKLDQIGAGEVERFKVYRLKQCSAAGVNRDLSLLRYALNFGIRQGYFTQNPVKLVKFLREGPGVMRILSYKEEELFLKHAPQPLFDIAVVMLETGMRPGEVYSIQRRNVDFAEHYIFVPEGKSAFARRTIPLTQRALEVLQSRVAGAQGRYLFPHRSDPDKHMVICRSQLTLSRKLKLNFRLYDLRHTFGSRVAMAGVDLPTLKELLGHSTIAMTMRYIHPTPEHKRRAMARFERHKNHHSASMEAA